MLLQEEEKEEEEEEEEKKEEEEKENGVMESSSCHISSQTLQTLPIPSLALRGDSQPKGTTRAVKLRGAGVLGPFPVPPHLQTESSRAISPGLRTD